METPQQVRCTRVLKNSRGRALNALASALPIYSARLCFGQDPSHYPIPTSSALVWRSAGLLHPRFITLAHLRVDLYEYILGCVHIQRLQLAGLIQRAVKDRQQGLHSWQPDLLPNGAFATSGRLTLHLAANSFVAIITAPHTDLVANVRPVVGWVLVMPPQEVGMVVAIEKLVILADFGHLQVGTL